MTSCPFTLRPMRDDDVPYVASTWLADYGASHAYRRAFRASTKRMEGSRMGDALRALSDRLWAAYRADHRPVVAELLARSTRVVACLREDDSNLWGFAVGERDRTDVIVLHYVYVKDLYRRTGVARALVEELLRELGGSMRSEIVASHLTPEARPIMDRYRWPFIPANAFIRKETARCA